MSNASGHKHRLTRAAHRHRLALTGELAAAFVHEIRQPLTATIVNLRVAQSLLKAQNPRLDLLEDIVADLSRDNLRAQALVSRWLHFSRNACRRMAKVDANVVVENALRLVGAEANQRRIALHADLAQGLPRVRADRLQLEQVLINLIVNGMQAMAGVNAAPRRLTVTSKLAQDSVEISVIDGGSRVPHEAAPYIFQSFYTTRRGGTGLGLSIVRRIVAAHKGRVWSSDNPSGGTVFHFTLPLAEPDKAIKPLPIELRRA